MKNRNAQHNVAIFGGRLRENKPLAGNRYSNLIYWAHVEAPEEGTFPMHPHEGIEIFTFVLEGGLEHFDTATNVWTPLPAGGVQQIQAGSGVYHSEKYIKGSRAFQIWFDPNFHQALNKDAFYQDFQAKEFTWKQKEGYQVVHYVGYNAPIQTDAEGVDVKCYVFEKGTHSLTLEAKQVYSIYVMDGNITIEGNKMVRDSFTKVSGENALQIISEGKSEVFVLSSPVKVSYL